MVVDWEKAAYVTLKAFLFVLEYCVKLTAVVVTAIVMAAKGTFGDKLATGFSSVSSGLRNVFSAPGEIYGAAKLVSEYNSLSQSAIQEMHGFEAAHGVMTYLNGGVSYLASVGQNFSSQPFATFFAAVIAFASIYLISIILRFTRQRGQGTWLNKLERELAERIFDPETPVKREPVKKPEPKVQKKKQRPFGTATETNTHLQEYLKSAQKANPEDFRSGNQM